MAKKKKFKRPSKVFYLICYGPTHTESLEIAGRHFTGKEFLFAEGILPGDLQAKGWREDTTWICPDCVAEYERSNREREQAQRSESLDS